MGDEGLERTDVTGNEDNGLRNRPEAIAANALHFGPELPGIDPQLAHVIAAWPTLPADVKQMILSLVASVPNTGD